MTTDARPVGVFDSGVGGLTVLRALRERLPDEHFIYLGDTARVPYGTKSPKSIDAYASQATALLREQDIKALVVACNTASAVALPHLVRQLDPLPVQGVIRPGAAAAVAHGKRHLVLATEATVRLAAYRDALLALSPESEVWEEPCEMLVALAEEGWTDGSISRQIVSRYLDISRAAGFEPDTVILGCTHFPLLHGAIRECLDPSITIVDSAQTTAAELELSLEAAGLRAPHGSGALTLMATDGATRFARVGGRFLGTELCPEDIEIVDL